MSNKERDSKEVDWEPLIADRKQRPDLLRGQLGGVTAFIQGLPIGQSRKESLIELIEAAVEKLNRAKPES